MYIVIIILFVRNRSIPVCTLISVKVNPMLVHTLYQHRMFFSCIVLGDETRLLDAVP